MSNLDDGAHQDKVPINGAWNRDALPPENHCPNVVLGRSKMIIRVIVVDLVESSPQGIICTPLHPPQDPLNKPGISPVKSQDQTNGAHFVQVRGNRHSEDASQHKSNKNRARPANRSVDNASRKAPPSGRVIIAHALVYVLNQASISVAWCVNNRARTPFIHVNTTQNSFTETAEGCASTRAKARYQREWPRQVAEDARYQREWPRQVAEESHVVVRFRQRRQKDHIWIRNRRCLSSSVFCISGHVGSLHFVKSTANIAIVFFSSRWTPRNFQIFVVCDVNSNL